MIEQLTSPIASQLALTLVHFIWQGSLVGLIYWLWITRTSVRSAQVRYAVSLLALSVLAFCPLVTFAVVVGSAHHMDRPILAHTGSETAAHQQLAIGRDPPPHAAQNASSGEIKNQASETDGAPVRPYFNIQVAIQRWQPYLLLFWLAGVMLSGTRLTAGMLNVFWLQFGRLDVPAPLVHRTATLARRLGVSGARVCATARLGHAAAVGFWKPVVLLPVSWLTSLPSNVLEAVIAHELAHIRRYDVWVNLLQRMLETLLFYHPMVWWLSNRARLERELCCDELAVAATGERGNYVLALEQIGRLQVRGNLSPSPAFIGETQMNLLSRVHYLLGTVNRKPKQGSAWLVGVLAITLPLVVIGVSGEALPPAAAQDRESGQSAEAEGKRRSAEADEQRRTAESEASRRSAEADNQRRSEEAEARRKTSDEWRGRRESDRPARESDRPAREGDRPAREGDRPAREGDRPAREGDRPAREGERPVRDGDRPAREGERPAREGERPAREGERPVRDGERPVRDGERPVRDGDRPDREGERPVRDGERRAREGERPERDGERPVRDGERPERDRDARGLGDFRPQTDREAVLYRMILELQREIADLRREMQTRDR